MDPVASALDDLSFGDLADRIDLVPLLARWHWNEWPSGESAGSEADWRDLIAERSSRGEVPFTKLAFLGDVLVATGSVCWDDADAEFADAGPWVTGVFVQGPARNLGIGRRLMAEIEAAAMAQGFEALWLHTGEAHRFYERCGWTVVRPRRYVGVDTVMRRRLHRHRPAGP
jgi:GNAT superfamily N-acetyltransferase